MFEGYFQEAQALRKDQTTILRLDLPDDDPNGMLFLCSLFHFNHSTFFEKPYTTDLLLKLAVVCDKYDCSGAINLMASHLFTLEHEYHEKLDLKSCHQMAAASYFLNNTSSFERFTKELIFGDAANSVNLESAVPCLGLHAGRFHYTSRSQSRLLSVMC